MLPVAPLLPPDPDVPLFEHPDYLFSFGTVSSISGNTAQVVLDAVQNTSFPVWVGTQAPAVNGRVLVVNVNNRYALVNF